MHPIKISRVRVIQGIGGFWVNDQPAIQMGAEPDGFFFKGSPVTPGFSSIREPSVAYCIVLELDDGQLAYGDCVTVLNAGYAGRPRPILAENLELVKRALRATYEGKQFSGFRDAAAALEALELDADIVRPVAFGVSQALLSAAALANRCLMTDVVTREYGLPAVTTAPGIAASCGGSWETNVEKAIVRRVDMFPQSAIQTRAQCEQLLEYASWIAKRLKELGTADYQPDLHFDFHSSLGRMFDNDEDRVCDFLADIVERLEPLRIYFEDPFLSESASEAQERMARLRERLDTRGPNCRLIADEWVNSPGEVKNFAAARAAHAFQIKTPDNGSLINTINAIQTCHDHDILAYVGGSCNETEISVKASVHVAIALSAWRIFTRPGLGFDEGLMVVTNERNRIMALLND